jgi:serine/threonine protein kinase
VPNILGDYELLEQIGFGATGRVWRARHVKTDDFVAVKELRGDLADDPEVRARFLNEGAILIRRDLPGVVLVHETLIDGDRVGLVMDLVPGADLRQLLSGQGPLPAGRACALAAQLANTLAAAHRDGLVHRDVKPENVMVVEGEQGPGAALLTDFGLARVLEETASTRTRSQAFGTPHYVAPEVLRAARAGGPADVYALGVVLFEMVLGWRPFRSQHPAGLMQQHLHQAPIRPADLTDDLWAVIERCLAKDPNERPIADVLRDQLDVLAGQLVGLPALPRTDPPTEQVMTQVKAPVQPVASVTVSNEQHGGRRLRWLMAVPAGVAAVALVTVAASGTATTTAQEPAATTKDPAVSPSRTAASPSAAASTPVPTTGTTTPTSPSPRPSAGGRQPSSGDSQISGGETTTTGNGPSNTVGRQRSSGTSKPGATGNGKPGKSTGKHGSRKTNEGSTKGGGHKTGTGTGKAGVSNTGRGKADPSDSLYGICQTEVKAESLSYGASRFPTYRWSRCQVGSAHQVYKLYKRPTGHATTPILMYNRNFVFHSGYVQRQWSVAPASWTSWLRQAGWGGNNGEDAPILLGYGSRERWSGSVAVQTWLKKGNPERDNRNRYLQSWQSIAGGRNISSQGYRREWNPFYVPAR